MVQQVPNGSRFLKLFLSFVCIAALAGGCAAGIVAYRAVMEARASLTWPKVAGKIVRAGVDVSVTRDRTPDQNRRRRETRSYSAAIEYEFVVEGNTVQGSRIMVISDQFGSRDWAKATIARYPLGTDVTVSYNPANPSQCLLEPGHWGGAGYLMILAGVFGLFPPLVLRAIWATKPVEYGLHPETREQRMLNGIVIRERILAFDLGKLVHLQRDSISLMSVIGGAVIAGLFLGLVAGLVPAMFFFSGRGPVFLGQVYLAASMATAIICAIWLWLDNRPRETRIEWSSRLVHLVVGSSSLDVAFNDIRNITVTNPQPKRPQNPNEQTPNLAVRINLLTEEKTYILAEAECPSSELGHVRGKMTSIAQQLAESMNVTLQD